MIKHLMIAGAVAGFATASQGQVLLSQDFNTTPSAGTFLEVIEGATTNAEILYGFNYSTLGIPSAPRSTGGNTQGLSLRSNINAGAVSTVNVYTSASFSNNYEVKVDVYPYLVGATGTSEYTNVGIAHSGTKFINFQQVNVASTDGYWLTFRTDASANDNIILQEGNATGFSDNEYPGLIWADSSDGSVANGARKGNTTPFAQSFFGAGGVFVNQWKTVTIRKVGNVISAKLDNADLFTYTDAGNNWPTGRVLLGGDDPFPSINTDIRIIYDNLTVTNLNAGVEDWSLFEN